MYRGIYELFGAGSREVPTAPTRPKCPVCPPCKCTCPECPDVSIRDRTTARILPSPGMPIEYYQGPTLPRQQYLFNQPTQPHTTDYILVGKVIIQTGGSIDSPFGVMKLYERREDRHRFRYYAQDDTRSGTTWYYEHKGTQKAQLYDGEIITFPDLPDKTYRVVLNKEETYPLFPYPWGSRY